MSLRQVLNINCRSAAYRNYRISKLRHLSQSAAKQEKPNPKEQVANLEDKPQFPGSRSSWTQELQFVKPELYEGIPVYRILNLDGQIVGNEEPDLDSETLLKMYKGNFTF